MKITSRLLSIPPYISTQWDQVSSLRVVDGKLVVSLKDGTTCTIPDLPQAVLDQIFTCHTEFSDTQNHQREELSGILEGIRSGFKDFFGMLGKLGATAMGSIGKALEHDPNNAHLPNLPPEMVEKVRLLLNVIPEEDILAMPEAHPDCNCMYCQINRTLRRALAEKKGEVPDVIEGPGEEPVEEKELQFTEWIVEPMGDKLYKVINKLDSKEEYRVFLGDPIGCTCGKAHCEHVLAVLRS